MPQLGLGVWQVPSAQAASTVREALAAGYRAIDTAAIYGNEAGVGEALAASGLPREELFITTKLWNDRQGYDEARRACEESLARLRLDVLDLYLIHWPAPQQDRYVESWRALIALQQSGLVRSIGVSNFQVPHLRRLIEETGVVPSVNQIELHPYFQQRALRVFHAEHGIVTESWSPLAQGRIVQDPTIATIAERYGKSPAQVVIRWHLDNGLIVIPKSVTPSRIRENIDVFDFALNADDLDAIAMLDTGGRIGPDPDHFA